MATGGELWVKALGVAGFRSILIMLFKVGCSGRGAPVISLRSLLQFLLLWAVWVIVIAWHQLLNRLATP
ncbi:MAG: hypothetical protein VR67_00295 [Peptococcaceae bacterium BRH_c8a]|nr:MAG: hypothetical protein VR67_00295 [Peptococcaceae bacterium BRH_c8a]